MQRILFFIFLFVQLCFSTSFANDIFDFGQPYFETVGDNQLGESVIVSMTQDVDGFIWIGTVRGLFRYDGYRFKRYVHEADNNNSLSGNFIHSLWTAPDGKIWIGTKADGVSIYNPKRDTFRHLIKNNEGHNSLLDNSVLTITGDLQGNVFIGSKSGLNHVNANTNEVSSIITSGCETDKANIAIKSLLLDKQKQLWIGSSQGLCRVALPADFDVKEPLEGKSFSAFSGQEVRSLFEASNNYIWIGTRGNGVAYYQPINEKINSVFSKNDNHNERLPKLNNAFIQSIVQLNDDEIWLATFGLGIAVFDANDGTFLRYYRHDKVVRSSINSDNIGQILVDRAGLLWIGTWGEGLNRHNPTNNAFRTLRHSPYQPMSLSHSNISAILELDDSQLWVGNSRKGIDIIDPSIGVVDGLRTKDGGSGILPDELVMALVQHTNSSVWVGTGDGLVHVNPATKETASFTDADNLSNGSIRALHIDSENILWIGTDVGLNRIDLATNELTPFSEINNSQSISKSQIYTFAETENSELWIGTSDGLFVLSQDRQSITEISITAGTSSSLSDNFIQSLLVDSHDRLWVATAQGIDRLTSWNGVQAEFESINYRVGKTVGSLGGNLLEDNQNRIWTNRGFIDRKTWQYISLDQANGWDFGTKWDGSFTKTQAGLLFYGGSEGMLMVRPELWQDWDFKPPVVLTELLIDNQSITFPPTRNTLLSLAADTKTVSFEFSALDYSAPEKIQYAYKLIGYDDEWIHTGSSNRRATYTNLSPGKYTLQIKATNRLGQWSPYQVMLPIVQTPYWYQMLWFKLVLALLCLSIFYGFYRWRLAKFKRQKILLQDKVQERTSQLQLANERLEKISLTDQLTGLKNRRFLTNNIDNDVALVLRNYTNWNKDKNIGQLAAADLIFFLIDLDHFKQVNDIYGHTAGDAVLVQIKKILEEVFRESDYLIRWGGEEFLIIARFTDRDNASDLAERLRKAVENHDFDIGQGKVLNKTCSIGFACYPFLSHQPALLEWSQVIDIADHCLYAAKKSSRNAWVGVNSMNDCAVDDLFYRVTKQTQTLIQSNELNVLTSISAESDIHW